MRLTKKRTSRAHGPVRMNWSGWRLTSVTLAGPVGKVLRWFGYGVEFYRAPRRSRR